MGGGVDDNDGEVVLCQKYTERPFWPGVTWLLVVITVYCTVHVTLVDQGHMSSHSPHEGATERGQVIPYCPAAEWVKKSPISGR